MHNKQSRNEPPGRWTPRGDRTDCKKSRCAYPGCRTNRAACTNSCQSCFSSPGLGHFPGGLRTIQAVEKRAPRLLDSPGELDRLQKVMTCVPRSPDEPGGPPRLRAVVRCVPRAFGGHQIAPDPKNASSVRLPPRLQPGFSAFHVLLHHISFVIYSSSRWHIGSEFR